MNPWKQENWLIIDASGFFSCSFARCFILHEISASRRVEPHGEVFRILLGLKTGCAQEKLKKIKEDVVKARHLQDLIREVYCAIFPFLKEKFRNAPYRKIFNPVDISYSTIILLICGKI